MNRTLIAALALSLPAAALAQTTPAQTTPAQTTLAQTAPVAPQPALQPVQLATTATVPQASLSLAAALRVAQLTVQNCAGRGYSVAATVVDRAGTILAVARAETAGPHTVDASFRKAYTSASARNLTSAMAQNLASTPTLADIPGFLILAGGVPVRVNNVVVGAVGVGGAPSGLTDERCAVDALTAVLGR